MKWLINNIKHNLAVRVLLGFCLGIFIGLFLGELASVFALLGVAYIRLFQMPVIPYIIVSLISGLGCLNFANAKSLFIKGSLVLLCLWGIIIVALILVPLGFPNWISASFFSTTLIEPTQQINFLELFLPSNPFQAMANTIIPSVVTFSVAVGLAFTTMDDKNTVMEVFAKITDSLIIITRFVAKLAPVGVFAIAANAAGTLRLEDFGRLQVYIIVHGLISLMLSFWVLPNLIESCTSIKYSDIIKAVRTPLVTAFATANLLVVLPILVENSKNLMLQLRQDEQLENSSIDVLIPVSFNFPNMGKLLSLAFIPFAAWYVGSPLSVLQYPTFLIAGIAVLFADGTLATTFLLNLFKIPADMLQLYITVEVFTARFGTLVAAMHTVTLGILGTCALEGLIRINKRKFIRSSISSLLLILLGLGSVHFIFTYIFPNNYTKDQVLNNLELLRVREPQQATVYQTPPPPRNLTESEKQLTRWDQIKLEGRIRVCYRQNDYPLVYFNQKGDLVGLDVEVAHILSRELGVGLAFVPFNQFEGLEQLAVKFQQNYCDIAIPARAITPQNAELVNLTVPVINMNLGFIVKDYRKNQFRTWQELSQVPDLKLAIPVNVSYYIAKIKGLLPDATIEVINTDLKKFLEGEEQSFDALILTAEIASALTILYPNNVVVVPQPVITIPVSYPLPKNADTFKEVVNVWLNLKKQDGTIRALYNYWVEGQLESIQQPRWSIIRDVLHWIK